MVKLLLVDDSRTVRLAARRMLASHQCELVEAENGSQALEVLKAHRDIVGVLLDWNMPVMDGITFLRTVRGDRSLPQPKIVMCTTEGELHRIVEAIDAGADEYIIKPFSEDIVCEKLQGAGVL